MNLNRYGSVRRLDLLLVAAVVGSATLAPSLASGQDPVAAKQAPAPGQDPTKAAPPPGANPQDQTITPNRGRRIRSTTRGGSTGVQIIPGGAPVATVPPGAPAGSKIQNGPDGKPMVVGPDGKPVMGPDGKPLAPVMTAPAPLPVRPGGNMFDNIGVGQGRNSSPFSNLSPGGTITMDFRGSDIQNVLKFFAMASNWQILPDPTLTGPVTIISPKPLTIDQAFQVLQSTLEIRGFSGLLEKRGETTILKIVPFDRATTSNTNLIGPSPTDENGNPVKGIIPGMLTPAQLKDLKNQVVTQVIPVDNVDAGALARELKELVNKGASLVASSGTNALIVTDTASNVQRIDQLVKMLDRAASNSQIQIFPLQHSDANDISNAINTLFSKVYGRGAPAQGQPGAPGQPQPQMQMQQGQPQQGAANAQQRSAVVASADTRTNSVIVVASDENMRRVADLIQRLDDPAATALDTKIVKMQYADALDIADTINSILSNSTPQASRSSQGASFNQRVFGGGFGGGFGGFGGGNNQQSGSVTSTDPFARVVGNARSNSLIVTATRERMEKIDELIRELDVPVAVESTTFVLPLKNAQAQDVAYILSQAFGTGTTTNNNNPFGGFSFGNNTNRSNTNSNTNQQPINRRQGSSSTNGRSSRLSPSASIEDGDAVKGALTRDGQFIPDLTSPLSPTAQFFPGGFGGFGGRNNSQMQTPQYGRGSNGAYVNLSQLRQNVGVVADPATNSLIITTTPDNLPILKQIIDSLDVMPRQVMIEVIIAEASLDAANKLGVQFDANGVGKIFGSGNIQTTNSNFPLGSSGSTATNIAGALNPGVQFGVQALSGRYNALIQALATDTKVRILSTPKVFTSNNQPGLINISTLVPYVSAATQNSLISTGNTISTAFINVGINLQVTPRIARDGLVTIDVFAEASELLGFDTLTASVDSNGRPQTIVAPRTSTRDTDTSVSVRDGEIVVLGGLMRDNKTTAVNKIPLLGDIPLIGHLFRSTNVTVSKTELMVFMIPHVVDSDATNKAMVDKQSENIRKAFPNLERDQPALQPGPLQQDNRQPAQVVQPALKKKATQTPPPANPGPKSDPDRPGFEKP